MNPLFQRIKAEAKNLGFVLLGTCKPQKPEHFSTYERWVQQCCHGEMHYLARPDAYQKREEPLLLFPSAKTILVLAHPYNCCKDESSSNAVNYGKIAAFAWEKDYHDTLKENIDTLIGIISSIIGREVNYRSMVDNSAILERDLAVSCGLGWIGNNGCLINPQFGSFILLCETMVDIDLTFDSLTIKDSCGSCSRCKEACPTKCIQDDRTIDARKCISYLTIEYRGVIPWDLRPKMQNWIFGCDLCQLVCPWNRKPLSHGILQENAILPFQVIFSMKEDEFNHRFENSTIRRTKYTGLLRNAIIAAGNMRDIHSYSSILTLLNFSPSSMIRQHACWSLAMIDPAAKIDLQRALTYQTDPNVIEEIENVITNLCK